jgi:hypothetical protein
MGSYSMYDDAFDNRFDIPSRPLKAVERFWDTVIKGDEESSDEKRYARWRSGQDKRWRARLPRKIERAAISLNAKTSNQLQSRFFLLPLEVREMIYDYIFDGGTVRLGVNEKVDGKVVRNKELYELRNLDAQERCLAILQSCKKTYVHIPIGREIISAHMSRKHFSFYHRYVEAAHLLYSTNTFMCSDLTTFLCFERLVPSHQWHRIKSIGIAWDYDEVNYDFQYDHLPCPTNQQTWNEVCRAVSNMKGLGRLRVDVITSPVSPYHDGDYELSQPLQDITTAAILEYFVYNKRKVLVGRCGCGCGRAEGFHESRPFTGPSAASWNF